MNDKLRLSSVIIKIEKNQIIKINQLFSYKVKIIKQDNKNIYIRILDNDLNLLENAGIEYKIISYKGIKYLVNLFKKNISILAGILIFTLLIYGNTMTIREITFSTYTTENHKIEKLIRNNIKSYYSVDFLNSEINDINLMLRKEFSNFEWISVKKQGSNLHVSILQPSILNKQVEYIDGHGDLVASKNGIIKFFKVSHGIPLIDENLYVKQGDILVSGNLRIKDQNQSEYYIPASGKVFAEVWYTKTIEVPKQQVESQLTGKLFTEKKLSLFGIDLTFKKYNDRFVDYEVEETIDNLKIFNFELPIGIKKIHYLEKNDIINVYNLKTSYDYAYSTTVLAITKDFREDDKILEMQLVANSEDEEKYTYVFFVRTYEDIAFFQRR